MTLAKRIETALLSVIRERIVEVDDGGLFQTKDDTKHWILDTAWLDREGIDITELSSLLADAIDIRTDPPGAA